MFGLAAAGAALAAAAAGITELAAVGLNALGAAGAGVLGALSAKERTLRHAVKAGKIQAGEAGLSGLRNELAERFGIRVDVSAIRRGGPFDQGRASE